MGTSTEERIITDELCKATSVDLYDLHIKYRLSVGTILKAVENLRRLGIAEYDEVRVWRTARALPTIFAYRQVLYNFDKPWKD